MILAAALAVQMTVADGIDGQATRRLALSISVLSALDPNPGTVVFAGNDK